MGKKDLLSDLRAEIQRTKAKKLILANEIRTETLKTIETLKPINLIKSSLKNLGTSPGLKGHALETAVGMGAGYLVKKVLVGGAAGPLKKILGTLLQYGITNLASNKGVFIKEKTGNLISKLFTKKKENYSAES